MEAPDIAENKLKLLQLVRFQIGSVFDVVLAIFVLLELFVDLVDLIFFNFEDIVVVDEACKLLAALYTLLGLHFHLLLYLHLLDSTSLNGKNDVQPHEEVAELAEMDLVFGVLGAVEQSFADAFLRDRASAALLPDCTDQYAFQLFEVYQLRVGGVEDLEGQLHPRHSEQALLADHRHQKFGSIDLRSILLLRHSKILALSLRNLHHLKSQVFLGRIVLILRCCL